MAIDKYFTDKNVREVGVVILRSNPFDADSRVEKVAKSLLKAGYKVSLLGWDRNSKYKTRKTITEVSEGSLNAYRMGIMAEFGAGAKNLKPFLLFQIGVFKWLIKNRNEYKIIHACDFDTAFSAYFCAKLLKKHIVFDIFDYLFTRIEGKHQFLKRRIVYFQHKIINYADATIICSEKRKEQIKGTHPKNLVVIHNSPPKTESTLNSFTLDSDKVKIIYVGILQDHRYLKELTEVVKANKAWELHIGGFGKYDKYFKEQAANNKNIIYYGKLSYTQALKLESAGDIMTAIYDPSIDNHYYAAPNKFYEALMLGKPLIMVKNTGMSDIVEKNDIGEVIEYNAKSLEKAINNLIERRTEWPMMRDRMRGIYEKDYSWKLMEERLIDLYRRIDK